MILVLALVACLHPGSALHHEEGPEAAGAQLVAPPAPPEIPLPQDVADAALAAARAASLEPAPAAHPVVGRVPDGQPWTRSAYHSPVESDEPISISSFDMAFSRLPWGAVEGDEVVVRWETRTPTAPGAVYLGISPEADPLDVPRFQRIAREAEGEATTAHEARLPLSRLLYDLKDVDGVRERGWATVQWRVEYAWQGRHWFTDGRTSMVQVDGAWVQAPTVTLGPMVSQLTDDGTAVLWFETDVPTAAAVGLGSRAPIASSQVGTRHEIPVQGLEPGTTVVYQVAVSDGALITPTPFNTFRVRAPEAPVRLAFMSDCRGDDADPGMRSVDGVNASVLTPLLNLAARRGADAVVFPGDLVNGYTSDPDDYERQLRGWLRAAEGVGASVPLYTGMGNHEALIDVWSDHVAIDKAGPDSAEARWADVMVNPSHGPAPEAEGAPTYDESAYSFDVGDVHVAVINTNYWVAYPVDDPRHGGRGNREGYVMDGQLAWLDADLTDARERGQQHLIVAGHEPAFPTGAHTRDAMWWDGEVPEVDAMRTRFWEILAGHGVLAYVAGDEHHYTRSLIGPETVPSVERPVWQIVSGGAGAPWVGLAPDPAYADRVEAFFVQHHITLWTFDGPRVELEVVSSTGETLERVQLMP